MSEAPSGYNPQADRLAKENAWARDWNNRDRENHGIGPDTSPIATMADGQPGMSAEARHDTADSWKPAEETSPDNVVRIDSHPGFNRVETPVNTESSPEAEAGPRNYAAEQEAALKALEINGRLSPDSSSILELSDAMTGLRPESLTYQKLDSRLLDKLVSDELHITNAERAGDLLNLSLKMLENPHNSPEIVSKLDNAVLAIFSHGEANFDLTQLQKFSALAKERHGGDARYFDAFDAQAAKLVSEGMSTSEASPSPATTTESQPSSAPLERVVDKVMRDGSLTERMRKEREARAAQPVVSPGQAPAVTPSQPTEAAPVATAQPTEAQPINPARPVEQPVEATTENQELKAEMEAEEARYKQLNADIQHAWRNLPQGAQTSQALSHVPQKAGFLDLGAFAAQLEQRMQASHLRANEQFAGLEGDGPERALARKKRVNQEFEKLLHNIDEARLASPEASKVAAEAGKIMDKYRDNSEKAQKKLEKLKNKYPGLDDLIKFDPHVQNNRFLHRMYGDKEL